MLLLINDSLVCEHKEYDQMRIIVKKTVSTSLKKCHIKSFPANIIPSVISHELYLLLKTSNFKKTHTTIDRFLKNKNAAL